MIFNRFNLTLAVHLAFLLATMALFSRALDSISSYGATSVLLAILILIQAGALARFVNRTNKELTRFVSSISQGDLSQNFSLGGFGPGYAELGKALNQVMGKFRKTRSAAEEQARFLRTLVDHVPVALLSVHGDGKVELWNNAAHRLFGARPVLKIEDMSAFGASFQRDLKRARPRGRILTKVLFDGVEEHLILSATQITIRSGVQQLISLQNIQSELDATELSAWQEMARVLTHEIMNSMTPVASLAKVASELIEDMAQGRADDKDFQEELKDIRSAVETLMRRSEGLMHFVQSYRQLSQVPPPVRERLALEEVFGRLAGLMGAEWSNRGIKLETEVRPGGLEILADPDQLDQALINLLRNAADAVAQRKQGRVWLLGHLSAGGRVTLEVADNGHGIDPEKADQIFIPFFTTKKEGTGVGLNLVRQVMMTHGGAVSAEQRTGGGTVFRLRF